MIVSSQRMSTSLPMPDSLTVGTSNVMFSQSVKTRCDARYASDHEKPGYKSDQNCKFKLRRINSIRHYLSVEATQKLVLAFVMSRLDYCTLFSMAVPNTLSTRLQKVQNNATLLILKVPKTDHITPHLQTLHWLPVHARIQYKICSLCFNAINSSGPNYLPDLLYAPSRQLRFSADTCTLRIPSVHTKIYGQRAISHCTYSLEQSF